MDLEMPRRRTRLAVGAVLIAALCTAAGCAGGSGSSGFDVSPLTESQAISEAIDGQECVAFEERTYCASGVEADTGTFQGAAVIIDTPPDPLVCDGAATPEECTASLAFHTEGFIIQNSLLAAVSDSERGPWRLAPLTVAEDVTGPRKVTITVPGEPGAESPTPVIAAVLVYAVPPEDVPQTSARLADFGADAFYVSPRLEIVVPR
jgi:hypothetical protein